MKRVDNRYSNNTNENEFVKRFLGNGTNVHLKKGHLPMAFMLIPITFEATFAIEAGWQKRQI